ncbi:DUF4856 domain-containing protein [Haliscomenobacter hydrossis]|uniref:DUF4856 domain-containing protein n=1 Tax=Haliscomenobacter hydrossis (strain ATCC 27775 / DSM 1100 / LMG 10767 / O) TaxID=760192 RepID=F4L2U3_HALH1|nr:hypothetical protein [Haliscomenobacter hydrossis]AEE49623.1 hypothetical protein Halhy_1734 [Haliscomenobacter hydrossis DSM 1100]
MQTKISTVMLKVFQFPTLVCLFLALGFLFVACDDKDDQVDDLVIPNTYDGSNYTANTTAHTTVRTALINLTNEMKKGRTPGTKVELGALNALYSSGTPSLKSYTNSFYNGKIEGDNGFLNELTKASGGTFVPGTTTGNGGTYGAYLFDENGVELEQLVEKGLFGAALYNQALSLMSKHTEFTPAKADQVLAMFGASPLFKSSDNATKHGADIDRFMANYGARRDKNDGNGLYTKMKAALITAQAAAKATPANHGKMLEAFEQIRSNWEKINAATVINYCHSAISTLSSTNPTDAQKAGALHSLCEAIGFLYGWRTLSTSGRTITDAQIDELLTLLNYPVGAPPKPYVFLTAPLNELPKLQQIISKLKTIYQFTDTEIEDFKKNWISEQSR